MLALESPQFRSAGPSHLTFISPASSPVVNDAFFWEQTSMCDPHHYHSSSSSNAQRRYSYADTTASGDSGHNSRYSVSSILHGPDPENLMDSMSSMSTSSHIGPTSTPDPDLWISHTPPPHSAPPISRSDPFEYLQHPVNCQAALPAFQDAYAGTSSVSLRPSLWPHPFRTSNQEILSSPWNSISASAGPLAMTSDAYGRMNIPWPHETARFNSDNMDPMAIFAAQQAASSHTAQMHRASGPSSGNASDSSSDGGSVASPGMSPVYYSGASQSTSAFNFAAHHGHGQMSVLHRTKSSPTTFGRSDADMAGQVCAVCGDHAACQHYGVRTCEGCKGFFKRTVQKGSKYVCLGNKDCLVDKKRRNRCQFCRYQKCLTVGMVKEVVRTDSLKGRRGRLPSKSKHFGDRENPSRTTSSRYSGSTGSSKMDVITCLVHAHQETSPQICVDYQALAQPTIKSAQEEIERFLGMLTYSATDVVSIWADKIPGFHEVSPEDRDVLINSGALELISLRLSRRLFADTAIGPDNIQFCNGMIYPKELAVRVMGSWYSETEHLSRSLHRLDLDDAVFASLCALVLVQERPFLTNTVPVLNLQTKIVDSLREYTSCSAQIPHDLFPQLLGKLQEIHSCGEHAVQRLNYLFSQHPVDFPDNLRKIIGLLGSE